MVINLLTSGSFLSEMRPFRNSHMILSFLRFLFFWEKKFLNFLLFVNNGAWEVTDNLWDIPAIYYSRLKSTNFVLTSTNEDARNRFLYLIFMQSPENLAFGLQILYAYFEPKLWLVLSKFEPYLDFHNALCPFYGNFDQSIIETF